VKTAPATIDWGKTKRNVDQQKNARSNASLAAEVDDSVKTG